MYSFNAFSLLGLVASEIYFSLGIYILAKNIKAPANKLFFFVAATMALWGLGESLERASLDPNTAFFWADYIAGTGAILQGPILLHFWLEFSGSINKFRKRLPILALYFPALILLAIRLFYPALLVTGMAKEYWGYSTTGTGFYQIYMLVIAAYVAAVVYLALRTASRTYGKLKQQARNIGLGLLFSLSIGIVTQVMRPVLHLNIPELSVISTFIFISFIAYAMNKYGLLDITFKLVAENIIATMEDYVVAVNRDKNIVLVNNLTLQNLGYKENELLDKPVSGLLEAEIFSLPYEELKKRFPLINYEANLVAKKGERIPVSANAVILKEESDETVGFAFVLRDMRQINELINGLEQKTQELEVAKKSLEEKLTELRRVNRLIVGRELKMEALRKEVEELKSGSGKGRSKKLNSGAEGGI